MKDVIVPDDVVCLQQQKYRYFDLFFAWFIDDEPRKDSMRA